MTEENKHVLILFAGAAATLGFVAWGNSHAPDPGPAYSLAAPVLEVAVTDADTIVIVPSPYYRVDPLTGVETEGQREHYVALSRFVSMHPGHWTDGQGTRHDVLRLVVAGDFDVITLPPGSDWARAWAELELANPGGVVRLEDWQ